MSAHPLGTDQVGRPDPDGLPLPALLARALLSFAIEYEGDSLREDLTRR